MLRFSAVADVVITFDDVGLGLPLQEALEAAGHRVTWNPPLAAGPGAAADRDDSPDLVILAPHDELEAAVRAWRSTSPPPALLVIGGGEATSRRAEACGVLAIDPNRSAGELTGAAERALALRFAGALSLSFARAAVGLPTAPDTTPDVEARRIMEAARSLDLAVVREALRRHAHDYVLATSVVASLREHRILEIPEVDLTRQLAGTITVQSAVRAGVLEPARAGRLLWALACIGGVTLTPEPPDRATASRRALAEARVHLRARRDRLDGSTYYDVLEVTPDVDASEVERAVRALALRYSPDVLSPLDLGDLAPLGEPMWSQIGKARQVVADIASRGRYNDWVSGRRANLRTTWANNLDRKRAEAAFSRGQKALIEGDPFGAVSAMAMACREHPDHPDYEASLAWARHRAALARDEDRQASARKEREIARSALCGRRPWARGLVALGLLCVADRDPEAARWHLHEALRVDPNQPAARQILRRIKS
jgi:hypothetical protein